MKKNKKIAAMIAAFVLISMPMISAKRYAVRTHTRHLKSGEVVRVKRHTRVSWK